MIKNILATFISILIFFSGVLFYGMLINLREIPLAEEMKNAGIEKISNPSIVIDRRNYKLTLFSDSIEVKSYKAVFGKSRKIEKKAFNDFVTPLGDYIICDKYDNHKYYKYLKLNYPNQSDAAEALKDKIISKKEFTRILNILKDNGCSYDETILGSNIGLHGIGKFDLIFKNLPFVFNWTNGSVALSNKDMEEIFSVVNKGTKVTIHN